MTTTDVATSYLETREREWAAFAASTAPLPDYWAWWEEHSAGWKVPIQFLQPLGDEFKDELGALATLLETLAELDELDAPPLEWLHLTYVDVGFLRPTDVMWSQVESFYVNAAPRIRRIEPFKLHIGGLSITEDGQVYLGVEDGGNYRELRRQIALGVPFVTQKMKDDPLVTADGDAFVPRLPIAYTTGRGNRARLMEVLAAHRDIDLGEFSPPRMKLARLPIQPHDHYGAIDVVAEIPLLGADHRKGYHN
ncbi:MAG: hypothetical protein O3A10_01320 [Chloroflexi bacterium]|nr:hypothetical protein [Chloroflexota bacterium]MDA1146035.1 hypothetical protein [Chloroflexota bacterium]